MTQHDTEQDSETITRDDIEIRHPKSYQVLLLNDNFTTMDFVVSILETVFKKSPAEAVQIMLRVHQTGRGVAGVYTRQIAEAKIEIVHERARDAGFPLRCTMEEV